MSEPHSADAWRRLAEQRRAASAVELKLPSGAAVLAARPDLSRWLMHGRLPGEVTRLLAGDADAAKAEMTPERVMAMGVFVADIVIASVVSPRIVRGEAGAGEISISEIPAEDADFIYAWALRKEEAAALGGFRQEPGDDSARYHRPDVRPAPKRHGRNRRPGAGDGL